jgi:hypothetical protein
MLCGSREVKDRAGINVQRPGDNPLDLVIARSALLLIERVTSLS